MRHSLNSKYPPLKPHIILPYRIPYVIPLSSVGYGTCDSDCPSARGFRVWGLALRKLTWVVGFLIVEPSKILFLIYNIIPIALRRLLQVLGILFCLRNIQGGSYLDTSGPLEIQNTSGVQTTQLRRCCVTGTLWPLYAGHTTRRSRVSLLKPFTL